MAQFNDFLTRVDLSAVSDYVVAHGHSVSYSRSDIFVEKGSLCRNVGIVKSGYFKFVVVNSKGQEVVTGFSFPGDVVTDFVRGILFRQSCLTSIVAGCDAELLQISAAVVRRHVLEKHPGFLNEAGARLLQEAYIRYLNLLSKTPAERYAELVARYPEVKNLLPVQELASFLGVSRRQFQRIREEMGRDGSNKNNF